MRLFCIHLTEEVTSKLRALVEPEGVTVTPCDDLADLPEDITMDDRFAVPTGDVLALTAALRERNAPNGIDILAITPPGITTSTTSTFEGGIGMAFIAEDELLRLPTT